MAKMTPEFQVAFDSFFQASQGIYDEYMERSGFQNQMVKFEYKVGKRYVKVINNHSVHAFVCMETGQIFKPASSAAPAKHARGNINSPDHGASCMSAYGPHYLR